MGRRHTHIQSHNHTRSTHNVEGCVALRDQGGDGLGVVLLIGDVVGQEEAPGLPGGEAVGKDALLSGKGLEGVCDL